MATPKPANDIDHVVSGRITDPWVQRAYNDGNQYRLVDLPSGQGLRNLDARGIAGLVALATSPRALMNGDVATMLPRFLANAAVHMSQKIMQEVRVTVDHKRSS